MLLRPSTPRSDRDPEAAAAPADSFARHALTGVFIGAIELAFAVGFLSEGVSTLAVV